MIKRFLKVAVLLALVLALVTGSAAFAQDITYDSQKLDTNYALALAYIGKEDYDKSRRVELRLKAKTFDLAETLFSKGSN